MGHFIILKNILGQNFRDFHEFEDSEEKKSFEAEIFASEDDNDGELFDAIADVEFDQNILFQDETKIVSFYVGTSVTRVDDLWKFLERNFLTQVVQL